MFCIACLLTGTCILDVKVGKVPAFNEFTKAIHNLESLKLTQTLDGKNVRTIQTLVFSHHFSCRGSVVDFIGDGRSLSVSEIKKMPGLTVLTPAVFQNLMADNSATILL